MPTLRKRTIPELKQVIADYQANRLPKFSVAFEYEVSGTFYFSAFTHKGFETHRFYCRLWTDSDGAIIGKCDCSKQHACAHLRRAVKQYRGH